MPKLKNLTFSEETIWHVSYQSYIPIQINLNIYNY